MTRSIRSKRSGAKHGKSKGAKAKPKHPVKKQHG